MISSLAAIIAIGIAITTTNRNYAFSKSQMLLQTMNHYIIIRKDRSIATMNNEKESCKQYYREMFDLYWAEFNLWRLGHIDDECMKIWMEQANKNNKCDFLIVRGNNQTVDKIEYNEEWNKLIKDDYFEEKDPFRQFMNLVHDGQIEEAMNEGKKRSLIRKFIWQVHCFISQKTKRRNS